MAPLLELRNLTVSISTLAGVITPVRDVSFTVEDNETVALVGESGSGKSMTARAILRLLPPWSGRIDGGAVLLAGRDLLRLPEKKMCAVRGNDIAMIFQEPMTSLNPLHTIGSQIMESLALHLGLPRRERRAHTLSLLHRVGLADAERLADEYPHRLSGGMRQRAMIAMALACEPKLLLADEPTTALDVTVQAQVLDLLDDLRRESGMGMLLITHDLAVVAEIADRVVVMYAGRKVEEAPVAVLFADPRHPYTRGLLDASPRPDRRGRNRGAKLLTIDGTVPSPLQLPPGCPFAPRCPAVMDQCREHMPALRSLTDRHTVACHAASAGGAPT